MRNLRGLYKVLVAGASATLVGVAGLTPAAGQLPELPELPTIAKADLLKLAKIDAPPAGVGLRVHADFPAEAPLDLAGPLLHSLTADITPDGDVQVIEAHAASGSSGGGSLDPCKDTTFAPTGVTWNSGDLPVKWRFRVNSIPTNMNRYFATRWMRKAHHAWAQSRSACDNPENIRFRWRYKGVTGKGVKYDGTNMIDFGSLGSGALAINYTWYKNSRIIETDMRLNKSNYKWKARPYGQTSKYVMPNVVTHELGHQVGLADLSDPHGGLTMFARIAAGEKSKMKLGRGDMRGAKALSP